MIDIGERLKMNGIILAAVACLFADDIVVFAESEAELSKNGG